MYKTIFFAIALAALTCAHSQVHSAVWQPSPGHVQVPIWPGEVPDKVRNAKAESVRADRPIVTDVSQPRMTLYAPAGHNSRAAVVVCPGGGYLALAMECLSNRMSWITDGGSRPSVHIGRSVRAEIIHKRSLGPHEFAVYTELCTDHIDERRVSLLGIRTFPSLSQRFNHVLVHLCDRGELRGNFIGNADGETLLNRHDEFNRV